MKTIGQLLKETRSQKRVSIKKVAKATKIQPAYLKALEADDYQGLSLPTARGFVKNYAEFLGISSDQALAIFRRDFGGRKTKEESSLKDLAVRFRWEWTPKVTTVIGLIILAGLLIVYLVWQYTSLVNAPYY